MGKMFAVVDHQERDQRGESIFFPSLDDVIHGFDTAMKFSLLRRRQVLDRRELFILTLARDAPP